MELEQQIEALLFYKGEPTRLSQLSKILSAPRDEVDVAIESLRHNLRKRGVRLMVKDDEVTLGTAPEMSELIERIRKDELSKEIGKAGLETLSIILYKGPVARSEVDYVRGVNSSFILRNLMIRGLVERTTNPNDSRSYLYKPTFELLAFLGVTSVLELPDFDKVVSELDSFMREQEEDPEYNAQ